jgi:hypothetical protein
MAYVGNAVYAQRLRLEHPARAITHPVPGRHGDVAPHVGRIQRPWSPAELLEASGGRLAGVGAALLRLQREQGNRHVQRVVAAFRQTGRDASAIQRKTVLGPPGDRYERAAELTAQRVTGRRPASGAGDVLGSAPGAAVVAPRVQTEIGRARGCGKPLPDSIRRPMEQAYGADFSAVRTHSDARADQLTRSLDALAFTAGPDIFFRRGAYAPASGGGQRLLAHELTHVIQQGGGLAPGRRQLGRGSTERIQRYLFGHGRYASRDDFRTAMGGEVQGHLDMLWESLDNYEREFPRNQVGLAKNTFALTPEEAQLARRLLIPVLAAADEALLGPGENLSDQQMVAIERLRVHTQNELSLMAKSAGEPAGRKYDRPTLAERRWGGGVPYYLASWLRRQPIYRKWQWRGAGECYNAAKEIFGWLRDGMFSADPDRVEIRAIRAIAPPGVGIVPYANHFVTLVHFRYGTIVVDPTMSQFLGCRRPLIVGINTWETLMRGARVDFGGQRYAEPASVKWRDFDDAGKALAYAPNPEKDQR